MNIERNSVPLRASRHAALADPVRLTIVDLLAFGDHSPHELLGELSLASNLLSHHLKVLESAGLVTRSRSEGDRRRTYVRLETDVLRDLGPAPHVDASRVVFVCTANSARSQLAEHIWRTHSRIPVASAGTAPAAVVAPGAIDVAAAHGLDLSHAAPRLLRDVEHPGDLRITVCDNAHEALGHSDLHWSVPDPVAADSRAAFESAYQDLTRRIAAFATNVVAA
jgi:protein-tyrosine-phosphatase/DNA-binding transcriptional ArsR family regulator